MWCNGACVRMADKASCSDFAWEKRESKRKAGDKENEEWQTLKACLDRLRNGDAFVCCQPPPTKTTAAEAIQGRRRGVYVEKTKPSWTFVFAVVYVKLL